MKLSLMTLSMYGNLLFKFQFDQDFEDLLEGYTEMIELIKDSGYKVVDITSLETKIIPIETINLLLKENNLEVGSYIYFDEFASSDEEGFEERVEKAKQAIDDAKELGTNFVMLVPRSHEGIENYSPKAIRGQLINHFRPIVEYAASKNVHVIVEDTPDLKLHFCKTEELKEVLNAVPGLEMVYDSGNMILVGEEPIKYYNSFVDKIAYVHLKDMRKATPYDMFVDTDQKGEVWTCATTGTGVIDLKGVIEQIKKSGYDGFVTLEFSVDEDKDYRKSLIKSREYFSSFFV